MAETSLAMANVHVPVDPLDELRLRAPAVPDRLPAMLFLAALVHGILIIGVTFNPQLTNPFADAISLEVTIVADETEERTECRTDAGRGAAGRRTDAGRRAAAALRDHRRPRRGCGRDATGRR